MLEIQRIRQEREVLETRLAKRGIDAKALLDNAEQIDATRRSTQAELDVKQAEMNTVSKEIGALLKSGKKEEAEAAKAKTSELKLAVHKLKEQLDKAEKELHDHLCEIPNAPHDLVPEGKTPEDNEEVFLEGEVTDMDDAAKPHWELGEEYGFLHMDLGVKVAGAGFPVYSGQGAKLQRSLISFFLDKAIDAGYREIIPPLLVNEASAFGTGQLPDKEGQMYHATEDNLFLIPTAEVPITNLYRDKIVKPEELPVKMTGYTPCFRREAGSYGKEVRGLNRVHQFDKVEIGAC